jgi:hypothetical protein
MRQRTASKNLESIPGPGQYDPSSALVQARSPVTKMNPYHNETVTSFTPGPGAYDPNISVIQASSPQYRIDGSEKRLAGPTGDLLSYPGPGSYQDKTLIGGPDSAKYSMAGRIPDPRSYLVPGPGYYEPIDGLSHQRSPNHSFSKLERSDNVTLGERNNVGPGTYDPAIIRYPSISYGVSLLERPD